MVGVEVEAAVGADVAADEAEAGGVGGDDDGVDAVPEADVDADADADADAEVKLDVDAADVVVVVVAVVLDPWR